MTTTTRTEHELLLSCRYTVGDTAAEARLHALLQGNIDWAYLFRLAGRHGVAALLLRTLTAVGAGGVPAKAYESFRQHVTASGLKSQLMTRRSADALRLFELEGLRTLAFKGASLAKLAYGDVALRQFSDLDLLVHRDDYARTRDMLLRHGYRERAAFDWEASFVGHARVSIDLHHGLTPASFPVPFDFDRWWRRRQLVEVDGHEMPTLSSEDLMIALVVQAAKDGWSRALRLSKVCDIAQVMTSVPGLDWATVVHEAVRLRVQGMLAFGVGLAASLFRLPVPGHVAAIAPRTASFQSLIARQIAELFEDSSAGEVTMRRRIVFHWHVREHLRDRLWPFVAILLAVVKPNALDRAVVALPASLSSLYYVIRPLRLGWKYRRLARRRLP